MKKLIILLAALLCSLSGFAYDDMGSYFECHNCSDCAAALNNNTYFEVHLVEDITNQVGNCIYDPDNFTNKIFDCQGHQINGNDVYDGTYWPDAGIYLENKQNNTIRNCIISGFSIGIYLLSSSNSTITNNTINNNSGGILIGGPSNSTLTKNTINNNSQYGIYLSSSPNNTMRNNTMNNNTYNFGIEGQEISHFYQDIDTSNLVDNKPIYYWTNEKNAPNNCKDVEINETSNVGFVALISCDNITVKNLNLSKNFHGILLVNTTNSKILNNTPNNNGNGIYLFSSSNNIIINNTLDSNDYEGIYLYSSSNNTLVNNSAINNSEYGIDLDSSSNSNTLSNNNAINNGDNGIILWGSSNNIITNNTANNNTNYDFSCVGSNCSAVNLNIGFPVSLDGTNFNLKKGASLGNDLERGVRYLNITNSSATDAWVFVNISYPENEDASKLFLARWNNSAWETDASKFTSAHGINSTGKYYYANITNFSLFVLFAEQAPTISLELSSSSIYVGNSITVSCSATDGSGVASVTATSSDGTAICSGTSSCSGTYKPSSVGTKTITCTATDNRGNEGSSSAMLTVYSPSSKSVSSVSSTSSIQASASTNKVSAGQSVSYNLSLAPNLPLITISVTFANARSGISLTASKIAAPPADAPAVPGIPSAYVKVEKNGFKDSDLSSTTLDFKVEKAWIDENGIDPAKVSVYRLENNTWTQLTTTKSGDDEKYIYYTAVSPSGLSIFAISGEKKTAAPPIEEKPPAAAETGAKPGVDYAWIAIVVIVLIIAGGVYYYFTSKKSAKK